MRVFFFSAVLNFTFLFGGESARYLKLFEQGIEELQQGKYNQAIETFKEVSKLAPNDPLPYYNIACAYSLMGKKKEALRYLAKAIELGFDDVDHMESDPDLKTIRAENKYKELVKRLYAKAIEGAKKEIKRVLRKNKSLFDLDFKLRDLGGKELSLKKLRGKVVLLDIWGTWCPPCRAEVPHLIRLQKEYGKRGVQVVGLAYENPPPDQALKGLKDFVKKAGINYPCALIDPSFLRKIPGFRGFPTLLFLDRNGKVRFKHLGYSPYSRLCGWIEGILEESKAPEKKEKEKKRLKWF